MITICHRCSDHWMKEADWSLAFQCSVYHVLLYIQDNTTLIYVLNYLCGQYYMYTSLTKSSLIAENPQHVMIQNKSQSPVGDRLLK